jgi:hypothetical protein
MRGIREGRDKMKKDVFSNDGILDEISEFIAKATGHISETDNAFNISQSRTDALLGEAKNLTVKAEEAVKNQESRLRALEEESVQLMRALAKERAQLIEEQARLIEALEEKDATTD